MYVPSRSMADLEKRGGYVPRREREQKAYNALRAGSVTGVAGVVTLVLSVITSLSFAIPVILLLLTAVFVYRFLQGHRTALRAAPDGRGDHVGGLPGATARARRGDAGTGSSRAVTAATGSAISAPTIP